MVIETTQKVDPEIAEDLLTGQERLPTFILGYIRLGRKSAEMVTVHYAAAGPLVRGQREVRALVNGEACWLTEDDCTFEKPDGGFEAFCAEESEL